MRGSCLLSQKLRNLKTSLSCYRTASRAVVFESDDWGMARMPSRRAYEKLAAEGTIDIANPFNKCSRERIEDLDMLFDVLAGCRDQEGRPAALTANFITANPDFDSIERSRYRHYYWTGIDDNRGHDSSQAVLLDKYREGMVRGLFHPQYHGRDHFSAEAWLRALRNRDAAAISGFRQRVVLAGYSRFLPSEYVDYSPQTLRPLSYTAIDAKVEGGTRVFQRAFGLRSLTSIAPFYLWSDLVEGCLFNWGVRCMQGASHCLDASDGSGRVRPKQGLLGQRSSSGMSYLVRNCRFEPAQDGQAAVAQCLRQIASAFARGYPAIIDTHRVNYVGVVDPAMRDTNLVLLRDLLRAVLRMFPSLRFTTSSELAISLLRDNGRLGSRLALSPLTFRSALPRRVFWTFRERYEWWVERRHAPPLTVGNSSPMSNSFWG